MSSKNRIGEYSEEHLLNTAKEAVIEKTKESRLLDKAAEEAIPKFEKDELTIGRVLGRGGFCVVNEITSIKLKERANPKGTTSASSAAADHDGIEVEDEHFFHNIVQDRQFMQQHYLRGPKKETRYAIKWMQESSRKDPQIFINSVVDLAIESRFLAVIRHPNIIKMRAMDNCDPYRSDFFIVMDKLYDIMSQRLTKWKVRHRQNNSFLAKCCFDPNGKKRTAFYVERLTVGYDIASALKYLHSLNIVYRDLKPDNIGFDVRGDVKIFDFGLAKELQPEKALEDGTYKLTADTGSPRYMAPEIALGQPYNETVDSYSFSILLWEILALEVPYDGYTAKMFHKNVVNGGARPKIEAETNGWGKEVNTLLKDCFVGINPKRPNMEQICDILRDVIQELSDEEINDILDASRKSELSAHK